MSRAAGRMRCPDRERWPLVPRPEVVPRFPPRPIRFCAVRRSRVWRLWSCMGCYRWGYRRDSCRNRRGAGPRRAGRENERLNGRPRVRNLVLRGADDFRGHVADAGELEDDPSGPAGDHAVARRGRFHSDARGVTGFDDAVRRANLYVEAGADAIFPEGLRSAEEFARFARETDTLLLANMTEFGTTPYIRVEDFAEMGYTMVIFPVTLQRAAMKAMQDVLGILRAEGTQSSALDRMQTRQELYDLLGYDGKVAGPAGR